MEDITLVLLCAGSSQRFGFSSRKQWLYVHDKPLWQYVTDKFVAKKIFSQIILVAREEDIEYMNRFGSYMVVAGGKERQDSVKNALLHVTTPYVMVSDVARVCITSKMIKRLIAHKEKQACIIPVLSCVDTVVYDNEVIDRQKVKLVQTPQLSCTYTLKEALNTSSLFTDDSSAIRAYGGKVYEVKGSKKALKITYPKDLKKLRLPPPLASLILCGNGFDVHAFEEGKLMMLGGVHIPSPFGFKAHSDGDVVIHALIDALLGAAGMGDIGMLFPDTDETYKNIDSAFLLRRVIERIHHVGLVVRSCDITIIAQKPRIGEYKYAMQHTLAALCHILPIRLNIKATTTEKLGFVGREEGVAVLATALLSPFDWTIQ